MTIITVEFLEKNRFVRTRYPDGWFWVLKVHDELFLQVDESDNRVTLWQGGWVEDHLSDDELVDAIEKLKVIEIE